MAGVGKDDEFYALITRDFKGEKEKEKEERNWRNDVLMENFLRKTMGWWNLVEDFDLSKVIMKLLPMGTRMLIPAVPLPVSPARDNFSWRNPIWAGVSLYRDGGNVAVNFPQILSQGVNPFCLAYSLYHLMCIQCGIFWEFRQKNSPPPPRPSLDHLILLLLPYSFRTFEAYSLSVLKCGVYKHSDFHMPAGKSKPTASTYFKFARPTPGAATYFQFADPKIIFHSDNLTENEYAIQIAYAVSKFGCVLLHVQGKKVDFPEILVPVYQRSLHSLSSPMFDHAVCCFEWNIVGGRFVFYCIDSEGGMLKTITSIHNIRAVMIFQIIDFTQNDKRVRRRFNQADIGGSQFYEHGESSTPSGHDRREDTKDITPT